MIRSILIFLFSCVFLSFSAIADSSLEMLASEPEWKALLHYNSLAESSIHSNSFFFSADGPHNSLAELTATVEAFKRDPTARCRFPARFEWLKPKLTILSKLNSACVELTTWFNGIAPSSATLVLASSFLNNPASAFGHTFLRFDQKNPTPLLSYVANYAAATLDDDALTYAVKGVFGGYQGFFSVAPYYQKVSQYSELENRDIWEYGLNFTPEEVRRMVLHLWELRKIPINYYYFDENCSYQLLSILDVGRPTLKLSENAGLWVIPVDTIRQISPIVTSVSFRPSEATKLKHRLHYISDADAVAGQRLADINRPVTEASAEALDAGYDLLTYHKIRAEIDGEQAKKRSWDLLVARGAKNAPDLVPPVPQPSVRPEEGHATLKTSLGVGRRRNRWVSQATIRPAFTSLLDPQAGYQLGAQIKFFETGLQLEEERGVDLDYLTVLDITSLTPRDEFFTPLSWDIRVGEKLTSVTDEEFTKTGYLGGGAGYSYLIGTESIAYALADAEVRTNQHYESNFNVGIGPRIGIVAALTDKWSALPDVSIKKFDGDTSFEVNFSQRYAITKDFTLFHTTSYTDEFDHHVNKSLLGVELFFSPP